MSLSDAARRGTEVEGDVAATSGTASLVRTVARQLEASQSSDGAWSGAHTFICEVVAWTLGWLLLFYLLAWTFPRWMASYPPSTKKHENDRYWCARNAIGILHAVLVCILSVPGLAVLIVAPDYAQFAYSTNIAQCWIDTGDAAEWGRWYYSVALSGLAFTAFTISDVIVSLIHRESIEADAALFVHHAAFVAAGILIRSNCMVPFNSAVLMSMEVSTPFLNYLFIVRHRGDNFKVSTMLCGSMFFLTYVIFRLILNTYGTVLLWINSAPVMSGSPVKIMPPSVASWQVWFLLAAVTVGSIVQFFWFPGILALFMKGYRAAFGNGKTSANGDYEKLPVESSA